VADEEKEFSLSEEEQEEAKEAIQASEQARQVDLYNLAKRTAKPLELTCEKCGGERVRREQGGSKEDEDFLRCADCGFITVD